MRFHNAGDQIVTPLEPAPWEVDQKNVLDHEESGAYPTVTPSGFQVITRIKDRASVTVFRLVHGSVGVVVERVNEAVTSRESSLNLDKTPACVRITEPIVCQRSTTSGSLLWPS